ncbi:hypothetical protein [Amycolatopsis solani]|uniref:hypothetical protein n=1 Tax=Amycolatopsis solani TaxID=3028615 RepID=UPI00296E9A8E|nr:hypothetical protein [Amycolatopsis sp. MEP2-6]
MASPDTDELATVPLPSGTPGTAPPPRAAPKGAEEQAAEAGAASKEPGTEELPAAPEQASGAAEAKTEPHDLSAATEAHTVPQDRADPERIESDTTDAPARPKDRGRWWRGLTGSLAAGLTVLALGVLVVAGVCLYTGAPGPGATLLIGHPVAAALALLAQRVADRRNGLAAAGAGVAVVLFAVSALTLFWLT